MGKGFFLVSLSLSLSFLLSGENSWALELKMIDFVQENDVSKVIFQFDRSGVKAHKFHVPEDKQIILDLQGVKTSDRIMRAMDTSEFAGGVVLISPYRKPGSPQDLRVALQLRDNVRSMLEVVGDKLYLNVENRFGVFTKEKLDRAAKREEKIVGGGAEAVQVHVPKSDRVEDILDNLTLAGNKRYVGKLITFDVRGISFTEALKMISDASGFNVILSNEVAKLPKMTLSLTNIPWDQALDTILDLGKLVATKNGNILVVNTLAKATEERRLKLESEKIEEKQELLVTKIFPISYANPKDITKILKDYLTAERGKISVDKRTSSLIVKDTVDVVEKIQKIIEVLDTQTPQIQIAAKIVEMTESVIKNIGLSSGLNGLYNPIGDVSGNPDVGAFSFNSTSYPSLLGVNITKWSRTGLSFNLNLMEFEKKVKIVATPKVVTQNGQTAKLEQILTSFYESEFDATQNKTTYASADSVIKLEVTPTVNNEGAVFMEVDIIRDNVGPLDEEGHRPPDNTSRKINTSVLVDNGSTVVLGGLYIYKKSEQHKGIPLLKDLPLIGWLFRTPYAPNTEKDELIVFVTPSIINASAAGLTLEADETLIKGKAIK